MLPAARRDNMSAVFGGGDGGGNCSDARQREQQALYAAELRQQVAVKEAAKAAERAHSLRQSAAHLEMRAAASVLPGGGPGGARQRGGAAAQPAWTSPQRALPTAPPDQPWGLKRSPQRQPSGRMPYAASGSEPWHHHEATPHEHSRLPPGYPSPDHGWQPAHAAQPPYGWDEGGLPAGPPPQWRGGFAPTQQAAPFATDLQPPQQMLRRPSMRYAAQPEPHASPPWADGELEAPSAPPIAAHAGSGCLAGIGAAPEDAAVRRDKGQRQAAFAADLHSQLAAKEAQRRRERERERAEDASKAAEAQRMLAAKLARGYGGGSGPLRDAQGHAVTDLNEVRRYQAVAVASPEQHGAAASAAAAAAAHQSIGAHWGAAAHERGGGAGPASPERQPSDAWQQQQQQQQWGLPSPQRQPSGHAGWLDQPAAEPARLPAQPSAASFPPPAAPSPTKAAGPPSALPGEAEPMRCRSDRPYETSTEAGRRMQAQVEFKEALRRQVEDNARLKAAELQRQRAQEAEEEARLERERERLREAFEADQSRQKAKAAAKEAAEGEAAESAGGTTIKVGRKPAPARGARSSAARPRSPPPPIVQPPLPPARQLSRQGSVGGATAAQALERGASASVAEADVGPALRPAPAAAPAPAQPARQASSMHNEWRASRQQEAPPAAPSQLQTPSTGLLMSESRHLQAWQPPPAGGLPLLQPPWALYLQQQQQPAYAAGPPGWGPALSMLPPQQQQTYSQAPMAPAPWALPPLPLAAQPPACAAQPPPSYAPLPGAAPWLQPQGMPGPPPPPPQQQQQPAGPPWAPPPLPAAAAYGSPAVTVGRPSVPFRGGMYETHSALAPASRPATGHRATALPPLAPLPAPLPAAGGLREWDALLHAAPPAGMPFSRQSSPTPPGPSEQEELPPARTAAAAWGGGTRSGAGLFSSDRLTSEGGVGGWRG